MGKPTIICLVVLLAMVMHIQTHETIPRVISSYGRGLIPLPLTQHLHGAPLNQYELPWQQKWESPIIEIVPSYYKHHVINPRKAICVLRTDQALQTEIFGEVYVSEEYEGGPITLSGTVHGLTPGNHGIHIHKDPLQGNDCATAGPHFNPSNNTHGAPLDKNRHAGDFGNIEADELGVAHFSKKFPGNMLAVEYGGEKGLIGRSIVIHEKEDDLGLGGQPESLTTGDSGNRQACCLLTDLSSHPVK